MIYETVDIMSWQEYSYRTDQAMRKSSP